MAGADNIEQDHHHGVAEHLVPMGGRIVREMNQIAADLGEADADEDRLIDGVEKAVQEQPSPVAGDVDLAPIRALEPDFDPGAFRTLARETFLKVCEARGAENRDEADGLLSLSMQQELNAAIDGDVAAHRHHILSQLDIAEATIVSAATEGAREKLGVRFLVAAETIERNADAEAVISDDGQAQRWSELWQFERDSSLDPSATDRRHALSFEADGWLFAHRGWVVTAIQRL
jgi:predicted lipid-binding transport protein (Tim44 family)